MVKLDFLSFQSRSLHINSMQEKYFKAILMFCSTFTVTFLVTQQIVNGQTTEQFLDEDQSMVCKHEKHLGSVDSNALICVTVQDNTIPNKIFENLMADIDTYEFD